MTTTLKEPIYYLDGLVLAREAHGDAKYTKDWMIELVRKTNKHPNFDGTAWGWYQVNNQTVGYWNSIGDDLINSGIDLQAWSVEATRLSRLTKKEAMKLIRNHRHNRSPSVHESLNCI